MAKHPTSEPLLASRRAPPLYMFWFFIVCCVHVGREGWPSPPPPSLSQCRERHPGFDCPGFSSCVVCMRGKGGWPSPPPPSLSWCRERHFGCVCPSCSSCAVCIRGEGGGQGPSLRASLSAERGTPALTVLVYVEEGGWPSPPPPSLSRH